MSDVQHLENIVKAALSEIVLTQHDLYLKAYCQSNHYRNKWSCYQSYYMKTKYRNETRLYVIPIQ